MITVLSSVPVQDSDGHYLDDQILVQFDQEIEASHLIDEYIKLYRCSADQTQFYEQVGLTMATDVDDPRIVHIRPMENLLADSSYILIVTGDTEGITSVGGDYLAANYTLFFETGTGVRPAGGVTPVGVDGTDPFISGGVGGTQPSFGGYIRPSNDVFSVSGDTAAISMVQSVPNDRSVGVRDLQAVILYYNDTVATGTAANALQGRYRDLPVDMDPFADRTIIPSGVITAGNSLAFDVSTTGIGDMTNREYVFTIAPYKVRGQNRRLYDPRAHTIRIIGPLTPVYATPDQISMRLKSFSADATLGISDYDLYKLIHEKSSWISEVMGQTMTADNRILLNRLTVCMVLLEIVNLGLIISGGNIKSRTLLLTSVVYDTFKPAEMATPLRECIRDATNSMGGDLQRVFTGIKSGSGLDRDGKTYTVYR